jgi:hypothetical protein
LVFATLRTLSFKTALWVFALGLFVAMVGES